MTINSCEILLLTENQELTETILSYIADSGYNLRYAENIENSIDLIDNSLAAIIIDSNSNHFQSIIKKLETAISHIDTILLYEESDFSEHHNKFKGIVKEFLQLPLRKNDLNLSLYRLNERNRNNYKFSSTEAQQDYHHLFDSVPSYIAVLNCDKEITEINRSFKINFGDHTGRSFFEVLKPGIVPAGEDPVSMVLNTGSPQQGEVLLTSEDGKQYIMMVRAVPIISPSGELTQVLTVLSDKTENRNLKDNLSALGLMLGTLSHNLKGSLTGLDAGLYLIDTGFYRDKPARIEEGLDVSKLMVDRIRKMIFNVLYYAKERKLNFSKTNVRQFAGDVAAHVENRILGGNIQFNCEFPEKEVFYVFDPDLLRSALINILENAREVCISDLADKKYQITFKVFIDRNNLVFEVHDNGSGMDEEQQKQLFSIFSSSKGLKGTGLGLYITNEVIRKHNGTITVTSEPGSGTCFSIKIPNNLTAK